MLQSIYVKIVPKIFICYLFLLQISNVISISKHASVIFPLLTLKNLLMTFSRVDYIFIKFEMEPIVQLEMAEVVLSV